MIRGGQPRAKKRAKKREGVDVIDDARLIHVGKTGEYNECVHTYSQKGSHEIPYLDSVELKVREAQHGESA